MRLERGGRHARCRSGAAPRRRAGPAPRLAVADRRGLDSARSPRRDRRPRDDRKLRAAHQAQRVWRRRDHGQHAGQRERLRRLDADDRDRRHRSWPRHRGRRARRTSRRRASARSSTGPARRISVSRRSPTTARRTWTPGTARTWRPRRSAPATRRGVGRGTAPGRTWCSRRSKTTRCRRCLCSLFYGLTDGYYLVGLPDDIGDLFNQALSAERARAFQLVGRRSRRRVFRRQRQRRCVHLVASRSGRDLLGRQLRRRRERRRRRRRDVDQCARHREERDHRRRERERSPVALGVRSGADATRRAPRKADRTRSSPMARRGPIAIRRIRCATIRAPATPSRWRRSAAAARPAMAASSLMSSRPARGTCRDTRTCSSSNTTARRTRRTARISTTAGDSRPTRLYKYMGGTSMAAPLVAGGAAVVRDFYQKSRGHQASAALVKAVLINSAVDLLDENNDGVLDNANPIPNIHEGWGRVDLVNATDASDHVLRRRPRRSRRARPPRSRSRSPRPARR